jgi:uncharacterized membrane protein
MQWPQRPVLDSDVSCEGAGLRYFRRRCSSFDGRLLGLVFGSLAFFSIAVSLVFAFAGAWLIVPFAGLEVAGLAFSAWWVLRRSRDFERIACDGDRILVEASEQGRLQRAELNRCWAKLVTAADGSLALRSHGREVVIGRYCGEQTRQALVRELRSRLGAQGI